MTTVSRMSGGWCRPSCDGFPFFFVEKECKIFLEIYFACQVEQSTTLKFHLDVHAEDLVNEFNKQRSRKPRA